MRCVVACGRIKRVCGDEQGSPVDCGMVRTSRDRESSACKGFKVEMRTRVHAAFKAFSHHRHLRASEAQGHRPSCTQVSSPNLTHPRYRPTTLARPWTQGRDVCIKVTQAPTHQHLSLDGRSGVSGCWMHARAELSVVMKMPEKINRTHKTHPPIKAGAIEWVFYLNQRGFCM